MECDVDGREERKPSCGRGGSGGGVPSLDGDDTPLTEALRETLCIMFSVGLAKSCCSTLSAFCTEALLFCGDVDKALFGGEACPSASALPVSGIKARVAVPHQGNTRRESSGGMMETRSTCETCVTLIRGTCQDIQPMTLH